MYRTIVADAQSHKSVEMNAVACDGTGCVRNKTSNFCLKYVLTTPRKFEENSTLRSFRTFHRNSSL